MQRSGETCGLDEGLDEHRRDVVALGSVLGQYRTHEREDVRAQVKNRDAGQDQEPRLVDHEREGLLAQLGRPSDEAVAGWHGTEDGLRIPTDLTADSYFA